MKIRFLFLLISLIPQILLAQNWHAWIKELRVDALESGVSSKTFDRAFHNLKPNPKLIKLDRRQPEKRITIKKYIKTRASDYKIKIGRKEFRKHRKLLNEVSQYYRVSPCMITALWGMESSYGRFMGTHNVIRSLATMAYDPRRADFFRKELLLALKIVDEGHIPLKDYVGEWAGGSGQSQFLPSSWYRFAVDYNQDGKKDIWRTHADIFASIANYLAKNGWASNQPNLLKVTVPHNFEEHLVNSDTKMPVNEWVRLGIKPKGNSSYAHLDASLISPHGGPDMLKFNNFDVIMTYNRSTFYAATIDYMAKSICKGIHPWP